MARSGVVVPVDECTRCGAGIAESRTTCAECGKPTKFMSFADRNKFEVHQWRAHQERASKAS